jgi:hypothetical protein
VSEKTLENLVFISTLSEYQKTAALAAVLELHGECRCQEFDEGWDDWFPVEYPCPTVKAIRGEQ